MSSNDLLSYSIMHKGHNVNGGTTLPLPMPLRPHNNVHSTGFGGHKTKEQIVLPPLSNIRLDNYTTVRLTEGNLLNLNTSSPPSLTSSSLSSSPISSPNMSNMNLSGISSPVSATNFGSNFSGATSTPSSPKESAAKRRQRLGPSCDSCRMRKVKCDADISVLSKKASDAKLDEFLSADNINVLLDTKQVEIDNQTSVVISNDKLIKFKSCKSCKAKNLPCCFAKGFTKEDIMVNHKKKPFPSLSALSGAAACKSKVTKRKQSLTPLNSRKSSCNACRKRKIKCVYNSALNKCEGCVKKDHSCLFENIN